MSLPAGCRRCLVLLFALSASLLWARADNLVEFGRLNGGPEVAAELAEEHRVSLEYQTPHTAWARPYARGTLRVLAFCQTNRGDTLTREIEELLERFDCRADAVYGDFQNGQDPTDLWIGGKAGEARLLRLLGQPYDCYLFLHISPQHLPPAAREKLEAAVNHGAGLVLVGTDDKPLATARMTVPSDPEQPDAERKYPALTQAAQRLREKPAFLSALAAGTLYQCAQGRAIVLPPRPRIDYHVGWEVEHDYWQETLGRACLWAAQREPTATLRLSAPDTVAWAGPPATVSAPERVWLLPIVSWPPLTVAAP